MIRGTTPTLEFTLPFEVNNLDNAFVTISQKGRVIIDKPLESCNCDGCTLSVTLTQQETLSLVSDKTEIQIRVKTKSGDALASEIITIETERILKDGVI